MVHFISSLLVCLRQVQCIVHLEVYKIILCGSIEMLPHLAYFFSQEYKQDNVEKYKITKKHSEGITGCAFISTIMVLFVLFII